VLDPDPGAPDIFLGVLGLCAIAFTAFFGMHGANRADRARHFEFRPYKWKKSKSKDTPPAP
jgi:hypothetical protein